MIFCSPSPGSSVPLYSTPPPKVSARARQRSRTAESRRAAKAVPGVMSDRLNGSIFSSAPPGIPAFASGPAADSGALYLEMNLRPRCCIIFARGGGPSAATRTVASAPRLHPPMTLSVRYARVLSMTSWAVCDAPSPPCETWRCTTQLKSTRRCAHPRGGSCDTAAGLARKTREKYPGTPMFSYRTSGAVALRLPKPARGPRPPYLGC